MLHAVNQYPIDIFLKSVVVRGMDHVYVAAFVFRHWIVSRPVFSANDKSTVKRITPSKYLVFFFFLNLETLLKLDEIIGLA